MTTIKTGLEIVIGANTDKARSAIKAVSDSLSAIPAFSKTANTELQKLKVPAITNVTPSINSAKNALQSLKTSANAALNTLTKLQTNAYNLKSAFEQASGSGNKFGSVIAKIGGAVAVSAFTKSSIDNAVQFESAVTALDFRLGENTETLLQWAKTNAEAFGMSQRNALNYSNVFSTLIFNFEKDASKVTDLTIKMMSAVPVIAAAAGRSVEDVSDRIRSGLLGSTEAIEDLGINVNVALLETTDAFKKFGNGQSWAKLDFATQQQIRYFAILEQAAEKFGTVPLDTPALKMQKVTAAVDDLKTQIGQSLLPLAEELAVKGVQIIDSLEPAINSVAKAIGGIDVNALGFGAASVGIGNFAVSTAAAGLNLRALVPGLQATSAGIGAVAAAASTAQIALGAVGVILAVISAAAAIYNQAQAEQAQKTQAVTEKIDEQRRKIAELDREIADKKRTIEIEIKMQLLDSGAVGQGLKTANNALQSTKNAIEKDISNRQKAEIAAAQSEYNAIEKSLDNAKKSAVSKIEKTVKEQISALQSEEQRVKSVMQEAWDKSDLQNDYSKNRIAEQKNSAETLREIEEETKKLLLEAEQGKQKKLSETTKLQLGEMKKIKETAVATAGSLSGIFDFNILQTDTQKTEIDEVSDAKKQAHELEIEYQEKVAEITKKAEDKRKSAIEKTQSALQNLDEKYRENLAATELQKQRNAELENITESYNSEIEKLNLQLEIQSNAIRENYEQSDVLAQAKEVLAEKTDEITEKYKAETDTLNGIGTAAQAAAEGYDALAKALDNAKNKKLEYDNAVKEIENASTENSEKFMQSLQVNDFVPQKLNSAYKMGGGDIGTKFKSLGQNFTATSLLNSFNYDKNQLQWSVVDNSFQNFDPREPAMQDAGIYTQLDEKNVRNS
jgi:hypothetical protein